MRLASDPRECLANCRAIRRVVERAGASVEDDLVRVAGLRRELALEEVDRKKLDVLDPSFPLILTVRARKAVQP